MAQQLLIDVQGCDARTLNDVQALSAIAHDIAQRIGAYVVRECVHKFSPQGITYVVIISSSHVAIHTWSEFGQATVDVFSCADNIPSDLVAHVERAFGATTSTAQCVERDIGGGKA